MAEAAEALRRHSACLHCLVSESAFPVRFWSGCPPGLYLPTHRLPPCAARQLSRQHASPSAQPTHRPQEVG